jgi:Flp pilus assembly protein TadD
VASAVFGFCLYANTLGHEYVLDDTGAVTDNSYVMEGLGGIPKILGVGMWHFDNVNLGYYRPLSLITFAVENHFFPRNAHVGHLGNVLIYALTGFVLCTLLMRLLAGFHPIFSLVVTLLFLAHPVHSEVVANIKSRDELLALLNLLIALFFLLAAHRTEKPSPRLVLLACVFYYLALISKESAMTGLLVAPMTLAYAYNLNVRQAVMRTLPLVLVFGVFELQKLYVLGVVVGQPPTDIVNYPYAAARAELPMTFFILLHCLRLVVLPHPLSYDYSFNQIPAAGLGAPGVLLGVVLAATLGYVGFRGYAKRSLLSFGVLFFSFTLAPALAFVFLRGGILAERFLYAPSLGFSIVLGWLLVKLARIDLQSRERTIASLAKELKLTLPVGLVLAMGTVKTVVRSSVWHDNLTLFSCDVRVARSSCQAHRHYGSELINRAMAETDPQKKTEWFDNGVAQLREALRINPHFGDALFKLGVAYQTVKVNYDAAIYYYSRAIEEAPGGAISYSNLGILYETLGDQRLASYYYNRAVKVNPLFLDGKKNSTLHKQKTGLDVAVLPSPAALETIEGGAPAEQRDFTFYFRKGADAAATGDYGSASLLLEKAALLDPASLDTLLSLANCYRVTRSYLKAIATLKRGLVLDPGNVRGLESLALAYEILDDRESAEFYRSKLRERPPR